MSISKEKWIKTGDPRSGFEVYDDEGNEQYCSLCGEGLKSLESDFCKDCGDEPCACGHPRDCHANENVQPNCCECGCAGFTEEPVRGKSEPDCPPRCCPKCKEESIEDFNGGEDDRAMCRCGHDQSSHKQLYLDGCPTPHFPCHGYGCECGKFERIDWDEADANRDGRQEIK